MQELHGKRVTPYTRNITPPRDGPNPSKWCVPSAVSALTGCTTDLAALLIAAYRCDVPTWSDARRVKSAYDSEAAYALTCLGFIPLPLQGLKAERPTYAAWLRGWRTQYNVSTVAAYLAPAYYVAAAHHASAAQGDYVADNRNGLVRVSEWPAMRARVTYSARVVCVAAVDFEAVQRAVLRGERYDAWTMLGSLPMRAARR